MPATDANAAAQKPEIFGVCRRLGDDFGFHPNILRVALAVGLVWSIEGVAAAYLALAAIVVVSRLIAPEPKRATASASEAPAAATEQNNTPAPALSRAA
ncbi:PspC domain-containing protein [Sphingomonas sp. CL5.1]|uniref:PspC domain-containing protein n=1 Tax=Sphingomonas sp. CL5.1 TaxID=2653203 RepID=UPI0015822E7F|nr:PspC domain-containing protein [Sphingomonas sp. CL5.1]QKR99966.1 PspC domain-containing protein [Sphingomonas sp. CL5.1]